VNGDSLVVISLIGYLVASLLGFEVEGNRGDLLRGCLSKAI
jgi:hypothetical protein